MMHQCREEKINLILTKSISRFGRNTLDILRVLQELRELNVDVFFEKEDLWLHERDLQIVLTSYCAFAQAESEDMSRNIRWGIKRSFQSGTSGYADFVCFGYKRGDDGRLAMTQTLKLFGQYLKCGQMAKALGQYPIGCMRAASLRPQGKSTGVERQSASY